MLPESHQKIQAIENENVNEIEYLLISIKKYLLVI